MALTWPKMSERGWCYLVFEKALRMTWLCSEKCWFGLLIIIISHVWSSLSSVEVGQNRYRASGFIVCLKWGTDSPDPSSVIKHHNLFIPQLCTWSIHHLKYMIFTEHVKQLFPWLEKTNRVLGACCFVSLKACFENNLRFTQRFEHAASNHKRPKRWPVCW